MTIAPLTKEYAQEYAKGKLLDLSIGLGEEILRCRRPENKNETHQYCLGLTKARQLIQDELDKLEIEQS